MAKTKCLLLAVLLSVWSVCAQETFEKVDRYYVGIGIQFLKVEENNKMFGPSGNLCNKLYGHLSGNVVVSSVLENSPASEAGLKVCDVISAIYGKDFSNKSVDEILQVISDGYANSEVLISVERLEDGNFEKKEFNVRRSVVDRVGWLIPGVILHGSMSGRSRVGFKSAVEEDKILGKFKYWYEIANENHEAIIVQWEVLDIVLSPGFGLPRNFFIKPGESVKVTVITDEFPEFVAKTVHVFGLDKSLDKNRRREYEEGKFYEFKISGADFWFADMRGIQSSYVPLNWLLRSEWRKNERRKYWP